MYVYIKTERNLWTVGFFHPINKEFTSESDYPDKEEAAKRVHWLNGGELSVQNNEIPPKRRKFNGTTN